MQIKACELLHERLPFKTHPPSRPLHPFCGPFWPQCYFRCDLTRSGCNFWRTGLLCIFVCTNAPVLRTSDELLMKWADRIDPSCQVKKQIPLSITGHHGSGISPSHFITFTWRHPSVIETLYQSCPCERNVGYFFLGVHNSDCTLHHQHKQLNAHTFTLNIYGRQSDR